jgi:chromosome segregation ATPase
MTITANEPPSLIPVRTKPRLARTFVRHVSAPVQPPTETRPTSKENPVLGKLSPSPPSKIPQVSPRPKNSLLSELSLTQSLASRLRRDRDAWRSRTQEQEQQLESLAYLISVIERGNKQLKAQCDEADSAEAQLLFRLRDLTIKHDKLADDLREARHTITKIRRSDRTKDTVHQINLRLKAAVRLNATKNKSVTTRTAARTESALQEALALAVERIDELECRGEHLLDALERQDDSDDSDDSDDEGPDDREAVAGLLEAQVAFRGALEDESFNEQRQNWKILLKE